MAARFAGAFFAGVFACVPDSRSVNEITLGLPNDLPLASSISTRMAAIAGAGVAVGTAATRRADDREVAFVAEAARLVVDFFFVSAVVMSAELTMRGILRVGDQGDESMNEEVGHTPMALFRFATRAYSVVERVQTWELELQDESGDAVMLTPADAPVLMREYFVSLVLWAYIDLRFMTGEDQECE